jgi:hypothetical protein
VIARPGGPSRLLDLEDGVTFLAFVEAVLRESPKHAEELDKLYRVGLTAGPREAAPVNRDERIAQIQRAQRLFGG